MLFFFSFSLFPSFFKRNTDETVQNTQKNPTNKQTNSNLSYYWGVGRWMKLNLPLQSPELLSS